MRFRVRIAADVWIQADAIDSWWCANRAGSPTLFREELEAALERVGAGSVCIRALRTRGAALHVAPASASAMSLLRLLRGRWGLHFRPGGVAHIEGPGTGHLKQPGSDDLGD
jgi:hypothetical protein